MRQTVSQGAGGKGLVLRAVIGTTVVALGKKAGSSGRGGEAGSTSSSGFNAEMGLQKIFLEDRELEVRILTRISGCKMTLGQIKKTSNLRREVTVQNRCQCVECEVSDIFRKLVSTVMTIKL